MKNVKPRVPADKQRLELDAIAALNKMHAENRPDTDLIARAKSFEIAFGMQVAAPEAFVMVAVLYWLLTTAVTLVMSRLERLTPTHRSTEEMTALLAEVDR